MTTTIPNTAAPASTPAEPTAPHILEALSYHANERDDLTLEDAVKVIRCGWRTVSGRTERAMLLQIADLLASAPGAAPLPELTGPSIKADPQFHRLLEDCVCEGRLMEPGHPITPYFEATQALIKFIDSRSAASPSPAPAHQQEPSAPTDLSKRLREAADAVMLHADRAKLMRAAADEIERYYGGMLAWKKTAETAAPGASTEDGQ